MTLRQIELVEDTFKLIKPIANDAGLLFYRRLIELDPTLRPMFRDFDEQAHNLMQVIGVAVGSLRRLDELLPTVASLGQRHVAYGVRDEHYETGGVALLWTFQQVLGNAFTTEVCAAWAEMYIMLTSVMRKGAVLAAA